MFWGIKYVLLCLNHNGILQVTVVRSGYIFVTRIKGNTMKNIPKPSKSLNIPKPSKSLISNMESCS